MSEYRVLARKYRPTTFDELIGQEHMVRVFANAFATDKIHHAYLLTGIRGIGKTTTARIIAMGLNCLNSDKPTTNPCKECENCKAIAESRHMDILEMDAASRTGVDDIRELIENIPYLPSTARYKVYIIDEVHMLTKNAFNALLKTLEEPPPHVKFIFATTEIRKIPITILSRCQRFDLRRLDIDKLSEHLTSIAKKEGFEIEKDASDLISGASEGSVRDGLSILDQAIAYSNTKFQSKNDINDKVWCYFVFYALLQNHYCNSLEKEPATVPKRKNSYHICHHLIEAWYKDTNIKVEEVQKMLCLTDRIQIFDLYEKILSGEIAEALGLIKDLYYAGGDPILITQDLMEISHFISRIKLIPSLKNATDIPEVERKKGAELADKLQMSSLARVWQMLIKGITEVKNAPSPLMALEMLIIRIAHMADMPTPIEIASQMTGEKKKCIVSEKINETPDLTTKVEQKSETINPTSFDEILNIFKKEPLLLHYWKSVGLVSFEVGKIEIYPKKEIPSDFTKKAEQVLNKITNQNWKIIISHNEVSAMPSLEEKKAIKQNEEIDNIKNHPVVKKVLETFPNSEIL